MLTIAEAEKILQTESNTQKREEAQRALVEHASFTESAWFAFIGNHCGQEGLYGNGTGRPDTTNLVYDCTANKKMLFDYATKHYPEGVTPANLEKSFLAMRDNLAPIPRNMDPEHKSGERKSANGNVKNMFVDQQTRAVAERSAPVIVPFTKKQLLEIAGRIQGEEPASLKRFKEIVNKYGSPAINRVLQSED
jgi:hypothetical protein